MVAMYIPLVTWWKVIRAHILEGKTLVKIRPNRHRHPLRTLQRTLHNLHTYKLHTLINYTHCGETRHFLVWVKRFHLLFCCVPHSSCSRNGANGKVDALVFAFDPWIRDTTLTYSIRFDREEKPRPKGTLNGIKAQDISTGETFFRRKKSVRISEVAGRWNITRDNLIRWSMLSKRESFNNHRLVSIKQRLKREKEDSLKWKRVFFDFRIIKLTSVVHHGLHCEDSLRYLLNNVFQLMILRVSKPRRDGWLRFVKEKISLEWIYMEKTTSTITSTSGGSFEDVLVFMLFDPLVENSATRKQ